MAKDVIMPALGMAQETGTLLAWHKQEGEAVTKGELLMTVATDKTDVDIEANATGILAQVMTQAGDEVPVGQRIALILTPEEAASRSASSASATAMAGQSLNAPPAEIATAAPSAAAAAATPVAARLAAERGVDLRRVQPGPGGKIQKEDVLAFLAAQEKMTPTANGRTLASPKARRLAQESGIDLAGVRGGGPDGAVLAADIEAAQRAMRTQPSQLPAPLPTPQPASSEVVKPELLPMSRAWRIMAQRLQQSWTTAPHFYLEREVNASQFVQWRERAQSRVKAKITYTDLMVKVVAAALRRHPRVNAAWLKEEIVANHEIHIGLAVAVEDGLLVPVVPHADQLGLGEIAARRATLVEKAQAGKLTPDELSGGTFTISNLGMYGIDKFSAIVNPPQAAILAVGRIADKIVPVNGQPAVQPMTTLTLSCDHRIVDGARAAQFMQTLVGYIEEPLSVLD